MRSTVIRRLLGAAILLTLAGCGSAAGSSSGGAGNASTTTATPSSSGEAATVQSQTIGGHTVLVAASNGMTLYQFSNDTAGSGTSACTGSCATEWPPLTVAAGSSPSAAGISGQWGTIMRPDGSTQVTYNGKPLYFFSGDKKAGDVNGNYPGWSDVQVSSSGGGSSSSPPASSAPSPYGY